MPGYMGPKCGVCELNFTKNGANVCNKCAGGDVYASQAIYGTAIGGILCAAIVMIVIYLRDEGFRCYSKCKCLQHTLFKWFCCKCCDTCCCKQCARMSAAEHEWQVQHKIARASLNASKSFFHRVGQSHGKRYVIHF